MADARDAAVWSNHSKEQWETNREAHNPDENGTIRKWLKSLTEEVTKVLDFGCGGGLWRAHFPEFDYNGSDQNEDMIAHAHKRFPDETEKFTVQQWDKLSFEDNSFDLVFSSAVLQHNKHPDKERAVKEIARILRPGGYYLMTENTFREDNMRHTFPNVNEWHEDLDDGYSFTNIGWEKFMNKFGFKLVEFKAPSEYLYVKEA